MPYQTSPEIDFSSIGLVVDVPSNAVPQGGWSNCLDVRCRNGSVQGVNAFADDIVLHPTDSVISGGEAISSAKALTPWTEPFLHLTSRQLLHPPCGTAFDGTSTTKPMDEKSISGLV
jgi:hypothetical protein